MSCYHPMILMKTSDMTDPEQRRIAEVLRLRHKGEGRSSSTFLIPREIALKEGITLNEKNAVLVPCGHCIGCRLDYARQWAERSVHEAEKYEHNYFLSLTYDDESLPKNEKGIPTLIHDEISDFMKRLRFALKDKFGIEGVRFFGCGEYGTHGERLINPHYHIILFNCPIPDLQERHPIPVDGDIKWIKQYADDGSLLMFSPTVYDAWCNRKDKKIKGTAQLGLVTFESCSYVARYCMKKSGDKNDFDVSHKLGIEPEYVRMSRRPGIGYDWFKDHLEQIYEYDCFVSRRGEKSFYVKPGKYCDKLLKDVDVQRYYELKEKRHSDFYSSIDVKLFDKRDIVIHNRIAEESKLRSIKLLKRN